VTSGVGIDWALKGNSMRAPRFVQNTDLYKRLKQLRRFQRFAFYIETFGAPEHLKDTVRRVTWNTASNDESQAIDYIETLRENLLNSEHMIDGRVVGEICRTDSKNYAWCIFIFHLVRKYQPIRCIEMGTCLGISGAFISAALKLNGSGRLTTLEGSPGRADAARNNLRSLDLENVTVVIGDFRSTLDAVLESEAPIDLVFVDGHHDGDATIKYFDMIRPKLSKENVVIFDDIRWSDGMRNAWKHIRSQTNGVDLGPVGVCVNVQSS
jgi:hypothetical protein